MKRLKKVKINDRLIINGYNYDNDPILLSLRNRAKELLKLGFKEAAIKQLEEYINQNYPDKLEDELRLLNI
ncbi:hypothetical protein [Sphingobacterium bovistauri]|uniref:Uncharacterized protein n=1 Tax=Sphingobacterium bovistauri TaxID=2781959 RepID=A0ABS7ZCV5_9SPHI|nr:hypothetical protein [Sphingobacterium bovistauri]MCA5006774.1 hypothetical protein [Sphingobacterium bovistauri]